MGSGAGAAVPVAAGDATESMAPAAPSTAPLRLAVRASGGTSNSEAVRPATTAETASKGTSTSAQRPDVCRSIHRERSATNAVTPPGVTLDPGSPETHWIWTTVAHPKNTLNPAPSSVLTTSQVLSHSLID